MSSDFQGLMKLHPEELIKFDDVQAEFLYLVVEES